MHESFCAVAASCINVHIICLCGHAEQEGRDERRGRSLFTTAKWLSPSHFNPHFALALCSLFVSPPFWFPISHMLSIFISLFVFNILFNRLIFHFS